MTHKDRASILRILDANLNRVAEALRVAEEACRFHWNLPGFAAELKEMRHRALAAVCKGGEFRKDRFAFRDIEGDVGRATPSPSGSGDAADMAFRNLERAKEAVRTLEEASRIESPQAAAELQEIRYHLYALEKGLGSLPPGGGAQQRLASARVYFLATQALSPRPLEAAVEEAVRAGVDIVQMREKDLPDRELLRLGRVLREITARQGALFIVNDRPDIALLVHADGVHLGQEDLPLSEVRTLVGSTVLIGVSTHSLAQARAAERQGADYIGVGPLFPTRTKHAGPLLGPEGLEEVLPQVKVPAFAIGGINTKNVSVVTEKGGCRIAVSSAILGASDATVTVRSLVASLEVRARPGPCARATDTRPDSDPGRPGAS
jgi:thiamine-phosphate pyrophosphorylase